MTPENVTAVITDIIKENQELKLRTSTLSDRMNEEVGMKNDKNTRTQMINTQT